MFARGPCDTTRIICTQLYTVEPIETFPCVLLPQTLRVLQKTALPILGVKSGAMPLRGRY